MANGILVPPKHMGIVNAQMVKCLDALSLESMGHECKESIYNLADQLLLYIS